MFTRSLILLALAGCADYPELVIPPKKEKTCEEVCDDKLDDCWPNNFHDNKAAECLIKHEVCNSQCKEES